MHHMPEHSASRGHCDVGPTDARRAAVPTARQRQRQDRRLRRRRRASASQPAARPSAPARRRSRCRLLRAWRRTGSPSRSRRSCRRSPRPGRSRAASLASSAVCRATSSSSGGMAISPADRQPELAAAQRHEARRARPGAIPDFCGSSPVLTCTNSARPPRPGAPSPWPARGRASAGPGSGSRRTGPRPRPPCWSAGRRSGAARRPASAAAARASGPAPPGRSSRRTRAGPPPAPPRSAPRGCDLLTAISVTAPGHGRPRPRAAAIRARTAAEVGRDLGGRLLTRLRHGLLAPLAFASARREARDDVRRDHGAARGRSLHPRLSGAAAAAPARPRRTSSAR